MSVDEMPISVLSGRSSNSTTPFRSSTIMIVDDEPTTIEILEMFLQGEGYQHFVKTTDSREVLNQLREERPDVLLLDLVMPEVGGMEILKAIREDENLRHTPVIILTSSIDAETKLQALELGATDFLGKPVDPSELALRLRNTLAAKVYQDQLTYYDSVTGLPNRTLFIDRLARMLARAASKSQECALLHIDLDRFKQINDALGHNVGDELLRAVAGRLGSSVRAMDFPSVPGYPDLEDPLSRLGGDEFAVLLPSVGADGAVRAAQRLAACLTDPFSLSGEELFVTMSIGVALFPNDGDEVEVLLANANIAMSHAKTRGRNGFQFYNPSLNVESAERLGLENQLRRAIDRKELLLHYQPKVDIETGRIIGCEALMRWDHPELGFVPPDRFIPIAEETGLIAALGEWALRTGCMQNRAWQMAGMPPLSMAINVSAKQFETPRLVEVIEGALRGSGMDPSQLVIELTESMIMSNPEETARMLRALKAMGAKISVDDFGTGHSSLASLGRYPIDELKIDRSFVENIPDDADDAAIANVIVQIGHTMGLTVVAEGVETEEQLEFLTRCNCDTYQGFLRSEALPPEEFARLFETSARTAPDPRTR